MLRFLFLLATPQKIAALVLSTWSPVMVPLLCSLIWYQLSSLSWFNYYRSLRLVNNSRSLRWCQLLPQFQMVSTTLQLQLVSTTTASSHGVNNYRRIRWCLQLQQAQMVSTITASSDGVNHYRSLRWCLLLQQAQMVSTITAVSDGVNSRSLKWCLPLPQSQLLSWLLHLLQLRMASSFANVLSLRVFFHQTKSTVHPRPTVFPLQSLKSPRFRTVLVKVRGLHLLSLFSYLLLLIRALGAF